MRVLTKGAVLSGALSLLLSCATAHAGSYDLVGVSIYTSTDDWNNIGQGDTGPCYSASVSGESVTTSAHDSITSTGLYATASTDIDTGDYGAILKEWKWSSDGSYDYLEPVQSITTNTYSYTSTLSVTGDSFGSVLNEFGDPENSSGGWDVTYRDLMPPDYRSFGTYDEEGNYTEDDRDGYYFQASNGGITCSMLHLSGNNGTAQASLDQSHTWTLDLGLADPGANNP